MAVNEMVHGKLRASASPTSSCRQGSCFGSTDVYEAPGVKRRRFIGMILMDPILTDGAKQIVLQKHMEMASAWDAWAVEIEELPVPDELCVRVDIKCLDCHATSKNMSWHFIGVQCPHCTSFDTTVIEQK